MNDRDCKGKLLKLIKEVEQWTGEHLEKKHPDIAELVCIECINLQFIAECRPEEEARAALHGAHMILFMLLQDAWSGQKSRGAFDDPTKVTKKEVLKEWNALHKEVPAVSKTQAVDLIAERLNCPTLKPGRTCSKRTVWSRLKDLGI